ncbi:phage tail protein [Escherichia coli]|nr:phage tail protein [Escherichia coli]ELX1864410.1 phage tail protein [Escherichia coli]ORD81978.1 phage tail protein [Escherichia coli]QEF55184.1 phage tail protein [Escherichia coli]HBI0310287.1 phage tail protein [Escherichia coli]
MTVKYYATLTNQGAARLANATMLGSKLNLTQMAVGDANGVLPTPDPAQTKLINQKRIAPLNLLSVDPNNQSQIIAEQIIPENEGGFWIREIGLYDDEGVLIAVANCPETYKPQLQEGSGRTQTIRMILVVTNTEAITLKIDPAVVLATRKYVDDKISEHEQSRRHPDASLTAKGFTQLSSATNSTSETLAATPKAVKAAYDLANGRQPANAILTALAGLATAADKLPYFTGVDRAALTALTSVGRAILSKPSTQGVLDYLGLGEGSALPVGVPIPWPSATPPTGWLKCNGAAFDKVKYPNLAKAYPSGKLLDLRGEFIRGWDDGRGIDAGRALLSIQAGMLEKHRHIVVANDGYDSGEEWELATIFQNTYTQGRGLDAVYTGGTLIPAPRLHSRGSIGNTGGSETRPRNIAFNFIVRAA